MTYRETILIAFYIFWITPAYSQTLDNDSIGWARDIRLKWTDFKGEIPSNKKPSKIRSNAETAASIYAKGYMETGLPNFRVTNYFIKNASWTNDSVSVELLEHEQLHFDIAELYARKIRNAVASLRKRKLKNYSSYLPIIEKLMSEKVALDDQYDRETVHSMNVEKQKEWCKKIAKELDELKKYASDKQ